jgi:hypothetical protein
MSKQVVLPGSWGMEAEDGRIVVRGGRFDEDEAATLAEVIRWWRHRRAKEDSADPLETHFGGVDDRAAVQTSGLTPAAVFFPKPLVIDAGASCLVHALGIPTNAAAVGEVYSLVGLCHFYRDATAGYLSRYATLGRAPAATTSTEVRSAVTGTPPGATAVIQIVGISGLVIDWQVEVYRLEVR